MLDLRDPHLLLDYGALIQDRVVYHPRRLLLARIEVGSKWRHGEENSWISCEIIWL